MLLLSRYETIDCFHIFEAIKFLLGMEYNIEKNETLRCLECGDEITGGRSDKKFCSDKCRNAYHNAESHRTRAIHNRIIGYINKNYQILSTLSRLGIDQIPLSELAMSGFNPSYFTSCQKIKSHRVFFCYEIKYSLSDTKIFDIGR